MSNPAKIILFAESLWSLGSGLFLPIFAIFSERVGGDILDAGIAAALFLLATSSIQLPLGKWLDKLKEKWFLASAYFLTSLVFVGYSLVANKWELFGLQIIFGIAIAVGDTAWDSMFDRNTDDDHSGRAWSVYHMFAGYTTAVGIIIGSVIVSCSGFGTVFIVGGIFAFVAGLVTVFGLPEAKTAPSRPVKI
jgi:MFS family permease